MKKILTIAIPTFNRCKELIECLDSIINQLYLKKELISKIEILISDNNSIDNTKATIKSYILKNKIIDIRYLKNDINLGFDKNVDILFKNSKGKYVWTLSDDDLLISDSLNILISKLNYTKEKFSIVYLNYISFNKKNEFFKKNIFYRGKKNKVYNNYKEMYRDIGILGTSLISSLVIKKKDWNNVVKDYFFNSEIIQSYIQFELFIKNCGILFLKNECFYYRLNNRDHYLIDNKNPFEFDYSAFRILNIYKNKIHKNIWFAVYLNQIIVSSKGILFSRMKNKIDKSSVICSIFDSNGKNLFSYFLITCLFIPKQFITLIYLIKKLPTILIESTRCLRKP